MSIVSQSEAPTASPAIQEQGITASLTAEIMNDLDDGQPTLVASTQGNQGDLQVVTPAQLLAKVNEQRRQLDQIETLANEHAAKVTIPGLVDHFGVRFMKALPEILGDTAPDSTGQVESYGWNLPDGRIGVLLADGISPVEQVAALRTIILSLQAQGSQA